jgi:hypothetical protein
LDHLIQQLNSVFDLKDLGSLHYFLGLQITRTSSSCTSISPNMLRTYLKSIICLTVSLHHLPVVPILDYLFMMVIFYLILMPTEVWLELSIILPSQDQTSPLLCIKFVSICQLQLLFTLLQPNEFFRYIRGTFNHGIEFTPGPLHLSAYTDADWAGDPDDRRSTSGFLVYLGNNAITWSAKKQPTVSRSSTESEYRALAIASAETLLGSFSSQRPWHLSH